MQKTLGWKKACYKSTVQLSGPELIASISNSLVSRKMPIKNDQGLQKHSISIDASDIHAEHTSSQSLILTKRNQAFPLIQHGSQGDSISRVRVPFWTLTFMIPFWSQPNLRRIRTNLLHPLVLILSAKEQTHWSAFFMPWHKYGVSYILFVNNTSHFWYRGKCFLKNRFSFKAFYRHWTQITFSQQMAEINTERRFLLNT